MEDIKPFFTENEEILWEGKPIKGARKEEFIVILELVSVALLALNSIFIYLVITISSGSPIPLICLIIGFNTLLSLLLLLTAKERSFGALSFLLTTKRVYVLAPSTVHQKMLSLAYFDFGTGWVHGLSDFYYVPLKKIRQINIRANTGFRKWWGILGYDVFISLTKKPFGRVGTYIFPQISEIPALVNVLMQTLGFSRKESATEMECYVPKEDSYIENIETV